MKSFILMLLMCGVCYAGIDTMDGGAITTGTSFDGSTVNIASADGTSITSGGAASDCDSRGTADFLWTGDNASGTDYACVSGGTQQASGGDSPTIDSSVSESTSTLHDGSNTVLLDADGNHKISWTVTAQDIADLTKGTVEIYFYPVVETLSADTEIFYLYGDSNNQLYVQLKGTGNLRAWHIGSGTSHSVTSTGVCTTQAWNVVKISYDVAGSTFKLKLNSDATDSDADALGTIGTNASVLAIGQGIGSINHDVRIDDVRTWSGVDDL